MKAADGTPIAERYAGEYAKWAQSPFLHESPLICGLIEELSAAEERARKLRTALHQTRDFIAVVEVEEGLTIDNLIEMIDSALKRGNEALEAR